MKNKKDKFSREMKKWKMVAAQKPMLTTAGAVVGGFILITAVKGFLTLLPIFGVAIVLFIAYKLYKSGFFG